MFITMAFCLSPTDDIERFLMVFSAPAGSINVEPVTFECNDKDVWLAFLQREGDRLWEEYHKNQARIASASAVGMQSRSAMVSCSLETSFVSSKQDSSPASGNTAESASSTPTLSSRSPEHPLTEVPEEQDE